MNKKYMRGLAVAALVLAGAMAQAQENSQGNGNPNDTGNGGEGNHYGWGDGVPAAPEPLVIAMASLGVLAVGGYILYRVRRNKKQTQPQA